MSQHDDKLAVYENEPDVREFLRLLEIPKTEEALKAPPAFHSEVMLKAARLSTKPGLFERWRIEERLGGESRFLRLLDSLRSLIVHPAFAYALVLLLCIPLLLDQRPAPVYFTRPLSYEPYTAADLRTAARAFLLREYKAAYEGREIGTLAHLWPMSEKWRGSLARLFAESQQIRLLLDIDETSGEVNEEERQVAMPFVQAVMVTDQQGHLSLQGPFFCIAELHLQSGDQWRIQDIREDLRQSGQCRPWP